MNRMAETLWQRPDDSSEVRDIVGHLDLCRVEISRRLDPKRRVALGQFLTSASVARIMASMLDKTTGEDVRLIDPGQALACCLLHALNRG